jgi:hypothetical protein
VSGRQQQWIVEIMRRVPRARVQDLVAHLSGVAASGQIETRDRNGLLGSTGGTFGPLQRTIAGNTMHTLLSGVVDLRVTMPGDRDFEARGDIVGQAAPERDRATGKSPVLLREDMIRRTAQDNPLTLLGVAAHETSHALDVQAIGRSQSIFGSSMFYPMNVGYVHLATEYKAFLTEARVLNGTSTGKYGANNAFAQRFEKALSSGVYPQINSLMTANPRVGALVRQAIELAKKDQTLAVESFIARLWELRKADRGLLGVGDLDEIEQRFYTSRFNEINLPVVPTQ